MVNIYSETLFACLIMSLVITVKTFRKSDFKYKVNRLFAIFCIFSILWTAGFYGVIIQTIPDNAYFYRAIGMIGTFGYLITAQFIICYFAHANKMVRYLTQGFSFSGIIIYFFVIQKDQVTYFMSEIGMSYSFTPGIWNTLYIAYTVIAALNMLAILIYMILSASSKKIRDIGIKLLGVEIVLIIGMLLDTIYPIIGKTAIPGSTIGQFIGLAVMYYTFDFVKHSRITISNMSEFIYYSLTVPVMVYDASKDLQILNDTGYSFFGIDKASGLNVHYIDQLFDIKETDVYDFEGNFRDVDAVCINNNLYCNLSINKIYDSYNELIGYIIIVTDLSERMKSIESLEAAIKEAEYANQAKSRFLANMSHEIRTPMNAIIGFSELTLKMNIDENVRQNVEDIKLASNNLLAIINDILDISKIESGKMELVLDNYYTSTLISDISLIIAPQANKKGLDFHMNVDDKLPSVLHGDKIRIRGILINILNNAVKYTNKGCIALDISVVSYSMDTVNIEFRISDTGMGIPEESIEHLFNSFERVDSKHHYRIEGTGLGLAIANSYVNLMGGSIKVDSTPDVGSKFTVTIPQKVIDATPVQTTNMNQHMRTDSSSTVMRITDLSVLIVDDNLVNLRVAHGLLNYYGLNGDICSSGEEAIEMCSKHDYDMIFLDQMMPGMNGIEAMKHIRELTPNYAPNGHCKIIVLTADAIKGAREKLIESGFDEYLGKPINLTRLEQLFINYVPSEKISYVDANEINNTPNNDSEDNTVTSVSSSSLDQNDTINTLSQKLPHTDITIGISNCGNNVESYLQILKITFEHGYRQLEELENMLKTKDYENYIIKIHALKSTSLNIGAVSISNMAKAQEEQGRSGNYDYLEEHFEPFKNDYTELLKDIESVLIDFELVSYNNDEAKVLDESLIPSLLSNISRCLNSFNFAKIFDMLEEIKSYTIPDKYTELFEKLTILMDDLEVDELKELIDEWM